MTTPSECFKKQVKANTCTAFNIFIVGVIILLPTIIWAIWLFTLPLASTQKEFGANIFLGLTSMLISVIINIIYAFTVALPFLRCYFRVEDF